MIPAERWAQAFVDACGEYADEGLAALGELAPCVRGIPADAAGGAAAARLDRMIRTAREQCGAGAPTPGLDTAVRLLLLLTKKGLLRHIDAVIQGIGQILDRKKGILTVYAESAFPLEGEFAETLKDRLRRWTGAGEIRLIPRIMPELLGGCRLRMGSEIIDATLGGQLKKIARDLQAAPAIPAQLRFGGF